MCINPNSKIIIKYLCAYLILKNPVKARNGRHISIVISLSKIYVFDVLNLN